MGKCQIPLNQPCSYKHQASAFSVTSNTSFVCLSHVMSCCLCGLMHTSALIPLYHKYRRTGLSKLLCLLAELCFLSFVAGNEITQPVTEAFERQPRFSRVD